MIDESSDVTLSDQHKAARYTEVIGGNTNTYGRQNMALTYYFLEEFY